MKCLSKRGLVSAAVLGLAIPLAPLDTLAVTLDTSKVADPQLKTMLVGALNDPGNDSETGFDGNTEEQRLRLARIMQAMGYRLGRVEAASGGKPWSAEPGPMFRIGLVEIEGLAGIEPDTALLEAVADWIARYPGQNAVATSLEQLESGLRYRLVEASYALAKVRSREIIVDAATRTINVRLKVAPGPPLVFGPIVIRGAHRLDARDIPGYAPFKLGDRFTPSALETYRQRLLGLQRYSSVHVDADREATGKGQIPIVVTAREMVPDTSTLDSTGKAGAIATAGALFAVFVSGLAAPTAKSRWLVTMLVVLCLLAIGVASYFAVVRIAELSGIALF